MHKSDIFTFGRFHHLVNEYKVQKMRYEGGKKIYKSHGTLSPIFLGECIF